MNGDYAFILNFHTALIFDDILSNILSILLRNTVDLKCILPKKKLLVAISGQMCLPCEMFCFVQFRLQIFDPFFEKNVYGFILNVCKNCYIVFVDSLIILMNSL